MATKPYLIISGSIFAVVGAFHLLRALNGWDFQLGPWELPMWASWAGTFVPWILSIWAFRLASDAR